MSQQPIKRIFNPWKTLGFALLCWAVAAGIYWYIAQLEQSGATGTAPWIIVTLYDAGGKALVSGFFAVVGAIAAVVGIAGILKK
ncbi:MAG TPA: hypothetical protein VD886_08645 [Herpetosiphonaceae bacterium]|nr:hypothetical protein [Herpetosiphonaceae bacterium]